MSNDLIDRKALIDHLQRMDLDSESKAYAKWFAEEVAEFPEDQQVSKLRTALQASESKLREAERKNTEYQSALLDAANDHNRNERALAAANEQIAGLKSKLPPEQ